MITRELSINDSSRISELLNVNEGFVKNKLIESNHSVLLIDGQHNSFIVTRKIGDINEVVLWRVLPQHALLFKSVKRSIGSLMIIENEESNNISTLLKAGFKIIKKLKGIYPKSNALILKLD